MAPHLRSLRIAGVLVVLGMLAAGCTHGGGDDPPPPVPSLPSAPDELPNVTVDQFHSMIAGLEGEPAVVNVWASWCVPCEAETPKLVSAAADHPDVRFVGVNAQDSREGAEGFITEHGITYPSVFDPDGKIITDLDALGPPVTVFYRADGTVEGTVVGELSQEALDEHLVAITGG